MERVNNHAAEDYLLADLEPRPFAPGFDRATRIQRSYGDNGSPPERSFAVLHGNSEAPLAPITSPVNSDRGSMPSVGMNRGTFPGALHDMLQQVEQSGSYSGMFQHVGCVFFRLALLPATSSLMGLDIMMVRK
jgi:hypothetical protein